MWLIDTVFTIHWEINCYDVLILNLNLYIRLLVRIQTQNKLNSNNIIDTLYQLHLFNLNNRYLLVESVEKIEGKA